MLTINENATVKSSNLKKVLAVLSSVAVIGAATTFLATKSSQSVQKTNLSKFVSDNMHGEFSFDMEGGEQRSYNSVGTFAKTVDSNGEWEVEYEHEGFGFGANAYVLKEGLSLQRGGNNTWFCQHQRATNGYAKYKYDLMQAVQIERSVLDQDTYLKVDRLCNDADTFIVENDDYGKLVICPQTNINGVSVGVVGDGFNGSFTLKDGKKKVGFPNIDNMESLRKECLDSGKFHSILDENKKLISEQENSQNYLTYKQISEQASSFPFAKEDRKLYEQARGGDLNGGAQNNFWNWPGYQTEKQRGPDSDFSTLDCNMIHGAGNNKGYKRLYNGFNDRYIHQKYSSEDNETGGENSKPWGPCWVYRNLVLQPKVNSGEAAKKYGLYHPPNTTGGGQNEDPDSHFGHQAKKEGGGMYVSVTAQPAWEYPGFNYYWGKNMVAGNVPGMPNSVSLLASCDWVTFSDFNSNQRSYKDTQFRVQNAVQICGGIGCYFGNTHRSLLIAHSMGVLLTYANLAYGNIKKGYRATVACCSGPAKGSIGAQGVHVACQQIYPTTTIMGMENTLDLGFNGIMALINGSKLAIKWVIAFMMVITSSCSSTPAGKGIYVIEHLQLGNPGFYTNRYRSPGLINHRHCGLDPDGLDSPGIMGPVNKFGCYAMGYCLQVNAKNWTRYGAAGSAPDIVCHYRGCNYGNTRNTGDLGGWRFLVPTHDNHVSLHSCAADARYYGMQKVLNGGTITLSGANHKNICCKKGNGAASNLKPCHWYQWLAQNA